MWRKHLKNDLLTSQEIPCILTAWNLEIDMANPNRTVAAARNQKTYCIEEHSFNDRQAAEDKRDEIKATGKVVRVTKYKICPRNDPTTKYMVRVYE